MNNNKFIASLAILFSILLTAGDAFAIPIFYPVSGIGSTTEIHQFNFDETPYIYADLSGELPPEGFDLFTTNIDTNWKFGAALKDTVNVNDLNEAEFWFTSTNWSAIRQSGLWNVYANATITDLSGHNNPIVSSPDTYFTVNAVPEPVSMILFISGGAAFAAKRLFRKRS